MTLEQPHPISGWHSDTPGPVMSLTPACYAGGEIQGAETEALFRHGWIGVGRADLVAKPGDYAALDIAGQAVILLRDRDGVLRAFANSCRHRGARLIDGTGSCRGIRCPFHSWAYRLDGTLVAAPQIQDLPEFSREDHGLIAYRAEERLGFAFLCLDAETAALDVWLGDFGVRHEARWLSSLATTRRRSFTVECDWKAFLEVFNEYYHLPFVHPTTVDAVYSPPEPANATTGAYATQFGATEGTGGLLASEQASALPPIPQLAGREATGVRYSWVFPNMTFAAGTDALWVYEAYPLGPGRCQIVQSACFPPETIALADFEERVAAYYSRLDAAIAEDIPALEDQHRGLMCPDARAGPLHPVLEANVASFAEWYRHRMAAHSGAPNSSS